MGVIGGITSNILQRFVLISIKTVLGLIIYLQRISDFFQFILLMRTLQTILMFATLLFIIFIILYRSTIVFCVCISSLYVYQLVFPLLKFFYEQVLLMVYRFVIIQLINIHVYSFFLLCTLVAFCIFLQNSPHVGIFSQLLAYDYLLKLFLGHLQGIKYLYSQVVQFELILFADDRIAYLIALICYQRIGAHITVFECLAWITFRQFLFRINN